VVTAFDVPYEPGYLCSIVNQSYCLRHRYDFRRFLLRPEQMAELAAGRYGAWGKVALLQHLLDDPDVGLIESDYLVWIDADALVIDHTVGLEQFVECAAGAELIVGEDTADADWLNTGVVLLRATPWCRELLRRWWSEGGTRWHGADAVCWDQSALCSLLQRTCGLGAERPWFSYHGGRRRKMVGDRVFVVDCGSLNFKHVNNCSFIFHAVQQEERLQSGDGLALPKLDRLRQAVLGHHVRGAWFIDLSNEEMLPDTDALAGDARQHFEVAWELWSQSFEAPVSLARPGVGWEEVKQPELPHIEGTAVATQLPASGRRSTDHEAPWVEPLVTRRLPAPWEEAVVGDLDAVAASLGGEDITVAPCAPVRASDAAEGIVFHRVKLWQLCEYCAGRPPPIVALCCLDARRRFRCTGWSPPARCHRGGLERPGARAFLELEPPGSVTRLHCRGVRCRLWQVVGRRRYVLCRSGDLAALRPDAHAALEKWEGQQPAACDAAVQGGESDDGAALGAAPFVTVLERGQALDVPADWWFCSCALTASIVWREELLEGDPTANVGKSRVSMNSPAAQLGMAHGPGRGRPDARGTVAAAGSPIGTSRPAPPVTGPAAQLEMVQCSGRDQPAVRCRSAVLHYALRDAAGQELESSWQRKQPCVLPMSVASTTGTAHCALGGGVPKRWAVLEILRSGVLQALRPGQRRAVEARRRGARYVIDVDPLGADCVPRPWERSFPGGADL